jgi:nucleoside-diphosphate-sugar epimerase
MRDLSNQCTCAITGSGGYLGSCVRNYFTQHGWRVLELTRQPKPDASAVAFHLGADVSPRALAGITALVHCAYDFKPVRWAEIHPVNVGGSEKLFRAARIAGVQKIICISSISGFEGCRSLYGKAKLAIERHALDHGALVLRPGLIYGDHPAAMFGRLVAQVRKAPVLPLFGRGSQIQYLVHQEDLSAFIQRYAAGQVTEVSQPLSAAHERPWTFRQVLEEIGRVSNKTLKFVPIPWRLGWAAFKLAELGHVRLGFRSDSLLSLMYQNPSPDFSRNASAGLVCRPFQIETLKL